MRILATTPPSHGVSWADRLGVWASAACVVHCVATPILLSFSAVFVHFLPSEEHTHRMLAGPVALFGAIALARGFWRHRKWSVLVLMILGLACIFTGAWVRFPGHLDETLLTIAGSVMIVTGHRLNHTHCQTCG